MNSPQATRAAEAIYEAWNHSPIFQSEIHLVAAIIDSEFGWKPISEAPKDGTVIWGYLQKSGGQYAVQWVDDKWLSRPGAFQMPPTHFHHLPTPPTV